ncbi:MAG: hypothetical protein ACLQQ4_04690 [Bacteroidia bacterium]
MEKEFRVRYDLLYVKSLQAAEDMGFNITHESITEGLIKFKTGLTIFSWGGTVKIWIIKVNETTAKVSIDSTSDAQLYTWGQNNKNKQGFMETLQQLLES